MKRVKSLNGYTIYEATKKDENKYNVTEGYFYIYFSSDIRDYGIANSYWDWEAGTLEAATEWCTGSNYAIAKEIVEGRTTAATYEEIEEVEAMLNNGLSVEEIEEASEETFEEYLSNNEWIDTEIVIAGMEMEFSFVWDGDYTFTEYGRNLYKEILQARYKIEEDYIEVFCDNEKLACDFVATIAGYTSESRYNKIITEK